MKKALLYVGSKADNSITMKVGKKIIENINNLSSEEIEWKIYSSKDIKINSCLSCNTCFQTGICKQRNLDDMELLKNYLIESDFIMLGSPVFAHNISGDMKTFIDRISYWMHMFRLAGKKCFVFSTCGTNGIETVTSYLNKCGTYLGLDIIGFYNAIIYDKKAISNIDFLDKDLEVISKNIFKDVFINKNLKSSRNQEIIFEQYKNYIVTLGNGKKTYLYKYWNENGMLNCNNYQDYLNKICENRH